MTGVPGKTTGLSTVLMSVMPGWNAVTIAVA